MVIARLWTLLVLRHNPPGLLISIHFFAELLRILILNLMHNQMVIELNLAIQDNLAKRAKKSHRWGTSVIDLEALDDIIPTVLTFDLF